MPLTTRLNGTGAPNLITSAWFNDYKDLLTGTMKDQNIVVQNNLTLKAVGPTPSLGSMAGTPVAGAGLGVGLYYYEVSFTSADGESRADGFQLGVNTTSGNQQVSLTAIPIGPTGTTGRNIYRTVLGGSGSFKLVTNIADNTTTAYTDSTPDGSLGVVAPTHSTFGGSMYFEDSSGNLTLTIDNDGTFSFIAPTLGPSATLASTGNTSSSYQGILNAQASAFGVKTGAGTRLMEIKNNGNMIISGSQYQTSAGSISTVSGQSFDSFDVAEVYESDQHYDAGTVLCPGNNNKLTKCLHDNCPCAVIVSPNPGLLLGQTHDDSNTRLEGRVAVALAGRVLVKTAMMMSPRTFVTTDGRGAIRPMQPGEEGYSLGFTLNETFVDNHVPQVGIFIRPAYVRVPK